MTTSRLLAFDQSTLVLLTCADDVAVLGNIMEMTMKLCEKCMEATDKVISRINYFHKVKSKYVKFRQSHGNSL